MSVIERIGIDIGPARYAHRRVRAAARAGARVVRIRFPLGDHPEATASYLAEAREAVKSTLDAGLRMIGVIDSQMTVAPDGAEGTGVPPAVAEAWGRELSENAARLAAALGDDIDVWEVLPAPNWRAQRGTGAEPRMAPERWARWLGTIAEAVRGAGAEVIAGGLISDESDDGLDYLRAAGAAGAWEHGAPFDAVAVQLALLPDGGPSEAVVTATVAERLHRLWDTARDVIGGDEGPDGIFVTGLSWDAVFAGESAQARNLWAAMNALTAIPSTRSVIWTGLVDDQSASGLHVGRTVDPGDRRPAWQAFNDFAVYAEQIDGADGAAPADDAAASAAEAAESAPSVVEPHGDTIDVEPMRDAPAEAMVETVSAEPPEPPAVPGVPSTVPAVPSVPEAGAEPPASRAPIDVEGHASHPTSAAEQETPTERRRHVVAFRMPTIEDVLRDRGLDGVQLRAAMAEVDARFGSRRWLPPGDYEIELPAELAEAAGEDPAARPPETADAGAAGAPSASEEASTTRGSGRERDGTGGDPHGGEDGWPVGGPPTNQGMLSAMYAAGNGSWRLLERAGLDLSRLAGARDDRFDGPAIDGLPGLTEAERQRIRRALREQLGRG